MIDLIVSFLQEFMESFTNYLKVEDKELIKGYIKIEVMDRNEEDDVELGRGLLSHEEIENCISSKNV